MEKSEKTPLMEDRNDSHNLQRRSCCQQFQAWLQSVSFNIYCSHALSAWGDRMWFFAVGLFLVKLDGDSLRLSAIYGFTSGGLVLLFGAIIGDWVDRNPRLRVAATTLILQNASVILCAAIVFCVFFFYEDVTVMWNGYMNVLCEIGIIVCACVAKLASVGNTIAIERDWIVEICDRDKTLLTTMSAVLRRIDLTTNILAPISVGQLMTFAGDEVTCIFIASWNLLSLIVEYYLIWKVYQRVPALHHKLYKSDEKDEEYEPLPGTSSQKCNEDMPKNCSPSKTKQTGIRLLLSRFVILYEGWSIYARQSVCLAGVGLACLYMTVLGFDSITTGYAYSQGVSEAFVSGMMAAGAIVGILGTFMYEFMRNKLGLVRSGLYSLTAEILCLTLCVASIWTPGSPFDPLSAGSAKNDTVPTTVAQFANLPLDGGDINPVIINGNYETLNKSQRLMLSLDKRLISEVQNSDFGSVRQTGDHSFINYSSLASNFVYKKSVIVNNNGAIVTQRPVSSKGNRHLLTIETTELKLGAARQGPGSFVSIGLLMAGIVSARFGLWISDLVITQLFLESVHETERGVVNGVQSSLNNVMDMIKFALVIALPDPPTFGILILISFAFICLGYLTYMIFSYRNRGHLLHLKQLVDGYIFAIDHNTIGIDTTFGILSI